MLTALGSFRPEPEKGGSNGGGEDVRRRRRRDDEDGGGGGGGGGGAAGAGESRGGDEGAYERVARMASGNAVVVFSVSGCCMCHVVKRLLLGLGVGPTVYELDQLDRGVADIQAVLSHLLASTSPAAASGASGSATASAVPVVFVGGSFWEGWKR
uniref:Glutaredoxin domain-containing protein n=1 Tax=Ananas comosus var. bracteatus TaxID=296719 RepID=A0A6V7QER4_ANACO|nr:unnamed protein product [Ananas comosus var. bracteatus]